MLKALILQGDDRHTYRLQQSMTACGYNTQVVSSYKDIPEEHVDVCFLDPSLSYDPSHKIDADVCMFYDCEDAPTDFDLGEVFYSLKDKVHFYAKMNWVGEDIEGVRLIGFPIVNALQLSQVAQAELPEFTYRNAIPFFVGAPTFLGRHEPVEGRPYLSNATTRSLGEYEDHLMYNQRIDWLLSLRENNIPHVGGLVFKGDNLSVEWQSKYFGEGVKDLACNAVNRQEFINALVSNRIGLNPTGHDRNSWRIYDLMATGCILISTEMKGQKALYSPRKVITINDGEDLGSTLLSLQPEYRELWKECQSNREVLSGLTPDKVREDFLLQLI